MKKTSKTNIRVMGVGQRVCKRCKRLFSKWCKSPTFCLHCYHERKLEVCAAFRASNREKKAKEKKNAKV